MLLANISKSACNPIGNCFYHFLRLLSHYVLTITATQTSNFTLMASPSCCVAVYVSFFNSFILFHGEAVNVSVTCYKRKYLFGYI